ncbi:MAG: recombination protein NinG [Nanoarchaeota archaeon]
MFNIKRRKADIEYSKWLRKEREYICEKCGKIEEGGMQVSHFWGRKNESVRFDPENTDVLCFFCHNYFTQNPAAYSEWKKEKIGERAYKLLMVRANTTQKKDDKKVLIWLKNVIK